MACVTCLLAALFLPKQLQFSAISGLLLGPALVYMIIFVGLTALPKLPVFSSGDYSYGVYLYGMPVQQSLMHVFAFRSELLLFLATVPCVTLIAMMSWHFIEKPILKFRKAFSFVARQRLTSENPDASLPVGVTSQGDLSAVRTQTPYIVGENETAP